MSGKNDLLEQTLNHSSAIFVLAGAGISREEPARLPTGIDFINAFYRFLAASEKDPDFEKRIPSLKNSPALRFEKIMSIIERNFLSHTKPLLECYEKSEVYNYNHQLLAKMVKAGHHVATTNFDCLIERAAFPKILPSVIMDREYAVDHNAPVVYKLHGAFQRYLEQTGCWESAADSIRLTLEQVGLQGYGFQMSPNKLNYFRRQLAERDTVIIGYSGSDDFDIMPILSNTPSDKKLIWVDYNNKDICVFSYKTAAGQSEFIKIMDLFKKITDNGLRKKDSCLIIQGRAPDCLGLLFEVLGIQKPRQILLRSNQYFNEDYFNTRLLKVMEDTDSRRRMKAVLHFEAGFFQESLKYFLNILPGIERSKNLYLKSKVLYEIALCYFNQSPADLGLALRYAEQSYQIDLDKQFNGIFLSVDLLARIYKSRMEIKKAINLYQEAGSLVADFHESYYKYQRAVLLNNYASVLFQIGKYDEAIENKKIVKKLYMEVGELGGLVSMTIGLASALMETGKSKEALHELCSIEQSALDLGKTDLLCSLYNEKGIALRYLKEMNCAIEAHQKAGEYARDQGDNIELARQYYNQALCWLVMGNLDKAKNFNEESINLREKIEIPFQKAMGLAECYQLKTNLCLFSSDTVNAGKYLDASNHYAEMIQYQQLLDDNRKIGMQLRLFGG